MVANLATVWEGVARLAPDRPAVVAGGRALGWREFEAAAERFASSLAAVGVSSRSPVAIMARNSAEYAVALFGTLKLGATPVNVNFRYTSAELEYLLADCGATVLLCDSDLIDVAAAASAVLSRVSIIVIGEELKLGATDVDEVDVDTDGASRKRSVRSSEDQILLYTGGTTGSPKGVLWTHQALYEMMEYNTYGAFGFPTPESLDTAIETASRAIADELSPVSLLASPLTHATALFMALATWLLGGTVVFLAARKFDPVELLETVERERVTQLVIVGDVFGRPVADELDFAAKRGAPYDISSLTRIASAGVLWSAAVKTRLAAHGNITLIDVLGASEGGPYAMSVMPPGVDATTTAFRLGDRAAVLTDDGVLVRSGDGVSGLLAVRGPIPVGYLNDPIRSEATFRMLDGERWSIPGDRAVLHADGTITLLGRGSMVINTGGEKVYPEEVERAMLDLAEVGDVAVVGVPDERWGEVVAAAVVTRSTIEDDRVRRLLSETLAGYKVPRRFAVVDEIPRSPVGKIDYPAVRQLVERSTERTEG